MNQFTLMLGNFVLANGEIDNISKIEDFTLDVYKCKDEVISIELIPLTKDWLLRFGFEIGGLNWYLDGLGLYVEDGNYFYSLRDEGIMDLHIKHVHQLQNLYFTLTEKQLIIKKND